MKNYLAFTKKEFLETWRTHRFLILLCIFVIFGIMNPLFAKITPDLLKATLGKEMAATIAAPTSLDSWQQFYKNLTQMGIYLVAILFSGCVVSEVRQGNFIQLVTKGLSRTTIILSKITVLTVQWLAALLLCFGITAGYTAFYFPDTKSPHPFAAMLPALFFGIFLLTVVVLGSTLARTSYEGLFFTIGVMIIMYVTNMLPHVKKFSPITLINRNLDVLSGTLQTSDLLWNFVVAGVLAVVCVLLAIKMFNTKKL